MVMKEYWLGNWGKCNPDCGRWGGNHGVWPTGGYGPNIPSGPSRPREDEGV